MQPASRPPSVFSPIPPVAQVGGLPRARAIRAPKQRDVDPVLGWFHARSERRRRARELYGAVVAQARHPDFYAVHGAPDTLEGRYEMIVLHLFLLLDRLQRDGEPAAELSRAISETFIAQMDTEMREMGVGDLAVPRKVKRAAAGLFERSAQYRRALSDADPGLLARFLAEIVDPARAPGLADYVRRAATALAIVPSAGLAQAGWSFPPPLAPPQGDGR